MVVVARGSTVRRPSSGRPTPPAGCSSPRHRPVCLLVGHVDDGSRELLGLADVHGRVARRDRDALHRGGRHRHRRRSALALARRAGGDRAGRKTGDPAGAGVDARDPVVRRHAPRDRPVGDDDPSRVLDRRGELRLRSSDASPGPPRHSPPGRWSPSPSPSRSSLRSSRWPLPCRGRVRSPRPCSH